MQSKPQLKNISAQQAAESILRNVKHKSVSSASQQQSKYFAPSNIALIKYWGKRNPELRLPCNDSLSISLAHLGATAEINISTIDQIILNKEPVNLESKIAQRTVSWLNQLLGAERLQFQIAIQLNIPLGAGLASSACWFAAIAGALNILMNWQLNKIQLSILARLGSGSAARSMYTGFVQWHAGNLENGADSYASPIDIQWPELRVGVVLVNAGTKKIDSSCAMAHCIKTATSYAAWPAKAKHHLEQMQLALQNHNFNLLGQVAEQNAILMHKTIEDSRPSISYSTAETIKIREKVQAMRKQGYEVYFTQDAGPHVKLLFEAANQEAILKEFTGARIANPFSNTTNQHQT